MLISKLRKSWGRAPDGPSNGCEPFGGYRGCSGVAINPRQLFGARKGPGWRVRVVGRGGWTAGHGRAFRRAGPKKLLVKEEISGGSVSA